MRFRDNYYQFCLHFQICEISTNKVFQKYSSTKQKSFRRKKFLFNILHLKRKSKYVIVFYILKDISLTRLEIDKHFKKLAASMNLLHTSSLVSKQRKVICTSHSQTIIAKNFFFQAVFYLESWNWTLLLTHRMFQKCFHHFWLYDIKCTSNKR